MKIGKDTHHVYGLTITSKCWTFRREDKPCLGWLIQSGNQELKEQFVKARYIYLSKKKKRDIRYTCQKRKRDLRYCSIRLSNKNDE